MYTVLLKLIIKRTYNDITTLILFIEYNVFPLTVNCIHIIHGKLLGAHANEERTLAIVKHEGTQEHA